MTLEDYARLIRARRIQLGMLRKQLAQEANCAEMVIKSLEDAGRIPQPDTLYRICAVLGLIPTTEERS